MDISHEVLLWREKKKKKLNVKSDDQVIPFHRGKNYYLVAAMSCDGVQFLTALHTI